MTSALIPLANGVEEMEAVIIIDVLRRARWNVTAATVESDVLTASRNVRLVADARWDSLDPASYDILILPGGAVGVATLKTHAGVLAAVRFFAGSSRKTLAAICAAPLVLQEAGILHGRRVTSHPSVASNLADAVHINERVVEDGNLITSQGPGTSFDFALALVRKIDGAPTAEALARTMGLKQP
jgi:4-methyl-5(b-hydroxyethyl)-thiazole monophosphate biosynthesis